MAHHTVASRETPYSGFLAIIRQVHQAKASHRSHASYYKISMVELCIEVPSRRGQTEKCWVCAASI